MRSAIVVAAVAALAGGCGGSRSHGAKPPPPPPEVAPGYDAARWIPARPTYAAAARSVRDAQRAAGALLDAAGAVVHVEAGELALVLRALVGGDPLSPEALAATGVDVEGGIAVFSDALDPTLVVHLAAPDKMRAALSRARQGQPPARPVLVDGVEVVDAALPGGLRASWAIADGWLWVHVVLPRPRFLGGGGGAPPADGGTAWLSASRGPGARPWAGTWRWAIGEGGQGERPAFAGFVDVRALIEGVSQRIPAALACARLLAPVGRLGIAVEASGERLGARLSAEVDAPAASGLAGAILPPPSGWATAASRAPLAAQWNLDLTVLRAWLSPCIAAAGAGADLSLLDASGVRAARVLLRNYDPDKPTRSRGAVALDLANRTYATQLLDQIPGRSLLQRKRTFGPYQGHVLSVPLGPSIEYVLEDRLALVGVGDGELAAIATPPGTGGPLFALDAAPPAMPPAAWRGLLGLVNLGPDALLRWRELHLGLALDGARLVLEVSGVRR